jgi:co-chaperonin GroES (HSP10)
MRILGNRILTTRGDDDKALTTPSGIIVQHEALRDTNSAIDTPETVEVLVVGEKVRDKRIVKGCKLLILGKSGSPITIEGKDRYMVRELDALAIL